MSEWSYESAEQKAKLDELVTEDNCGEKLRLMRALSGHSRRDLAKVLGGPESTIYRLERKQTLPTAVFMTSLRGLELVGYDRFSKMSAGEKESISETLGTAGGITVGVGGSVAAISVSGSVAGLSAPGITSGLAAIGGTMIGGVVVACSIPLAAGLSCYCLVKGIKALCATSNLDCTDVNDRYDKASVDSSAPAA